MSSLFSLPQRVSRIYPVLALVLAITSSTLLYAWQATNYELDNLSKLAEHEKTLNSQIQRLTENQKIDQAKLQVQTKNIEEATAKLKSLEGQLESKNAQLVQAQEQLRNQQSQLAQNASELEKLRARPPLFSFKAAASVPNLQQKQADIKEVVTNAYSYIEALYGSPYLLSSIVISFVDSFDIAGSAGEIIIENSNEGIRITIRLKDFDKNNFQDVNTIIHEMIHGFHGVAVADASAMEEGMTIAATDAVMTKMIADGKLPKFDHLYLVINAETYTNWNSSLRIHANNDNFYKDPDVAKVYQLIGTAWYQLYENEPEIFKKVNAAYYPKVQKGLNPDTALLLDAIRASIKQVNGQPTDTFLKSNRAFNPY